MNPGEVRSDLIGAYILREWYVQNMPHIIDGWSLTVNDATRMTAERAISMMPTLDLVFVGQSPIARIAIERWGLTNVAYLAAGTPTPFSPSPHQLRYYTDANPGAVAEATQAGYDTQLVDVRNPDDLKKLDGVTTLVATGLMHFLPDAAARAMFANIARLGFEAFIFNNANPITVAFADDEHAGTLSVTDQYAKMGMQLYFRSPDEIEALMRGHLRLEHAILLSDFLKDHFLSPYFPENRSIYTVYHATAL